MRKITKKRSEKIFFLISVIQIILVLSMTPAYTFSLSQTNDYEFPYKLNDENNFGKFLKKIFSIPQIGIVSAQQEGETFNCCLQTNSGLFCQDVASGTQSSTEPLSCANPLPTSCAQTSQCVLGTCVINDGESCSANTGRQECESQEFAVWDERQFNEISECEKGACIFGCDVKFLTEKQCEIESASLGVQMEFRQGVTELEFGEIEQCTGNDGRGACLLGNGNCGFVTYSECVSANGEDWLEGVLCTNPELETNCTPTQETSCNVDDGKVYFLDSCGNLGNIYDANKINIEENPEYWNEIVNSNDLCEVDPANPNSVKNCGNCNVFLSTQCAEVENANQVKHGDFYCKDLRCVDSEGRTRLNGERWCEYDGYVGEGKDPVGSEHWLVSCTNGVIEQNSCGSYRGGICEQSVIVDNDLTFSTAACVPNLAFQCIDYNGNEDTRAQNCGENSQCQLKTIDIADQFKFDFCAPEYPRGLSLKGSQEDNRAICGLASTTCTVVYEKKISGWEPIINEDCEKREFAEKMNDLCISLGDCGSYINYFGKGTNNIEVENTENIDWSDYTQYKDNPQGRYIQSAGIEEYGQYFGIESIDGEYDSEDIDALTSGLGLSGSLFLLGYLNAEKTSGGSGISTGANAISWLDKLFGGSGGGATATGPGSAIPGYYGNNAAAQSIFGAAKPFVNGALGAVAGYFAGQMIANFFGIQGTYATVISVAGAVIGAIVGYQGISNITWAAGGAAIAVAVVVIVVIIALGLGKTKEVKVNFSCLPWQAPTGGEDCSQCGSDGKPCTQYRCESLGQACQLINEDTNNPICESLPYEPNPPVLGFGDVGPANNLSIYNFTFQNPNGNSIELRQENGECIPEFEPIRFMIKTDEYAQCKWSFEPSATYESMPNLYGLEGTTYSLEHNFFFEGFSLSLLEAEGISGDLIQGFFGDRNIYIKCQDYFGNFNINDYVVNVCVKSGPDLTPVLHYHTVTNPANGSILKYGTTETNFTMWTNEPAECRYDSVGGRDFSEMTGLMYCQTNLTDYELYGWPCSGNLTNLQENNTYYIRCNDQPWKELTNESNLRNNNSEDLVYVLYVNQNALAIESMSVTFMEATTNIPLDSETPAVIRGGGDEFTVELEVETVNGSENGIAECSYTWAGNTVPFFETNARTHNQELMLNSGNQDLLVTCTDTSGEVITENMEFTLEIDDEEPIVIRAYNQGGSLRIITNEQAICYMSFDEQRQCNFDINSNVSIEMTSGISTEHSATWDEGQTYYIKCEDVWENLNTGCGIIVSPSSAV